MSFESQKGHILMRLEMGDDGSLVNYLSDTINGCFSKMDPEKNAITILISLKNISTSFIFLLTFPFNP